MISRRKPVLFYNTARGVGVKGNFVPSEFGLTELPINLTVAGTLYITGRGIRNLPEGLIVQGNLRFSEVTLCELPEDLVVHGRLSMYKSTIDGYPMVEECGDSKRTIYLDIKDKSLIHIGCFHGAMDKALKKVDLKYTDFSTVGEIYKEKIIECFKMGGEDK